jgi:VanZ family protein
MSESPLKANGSGQEACGLELLLRPAVIESIHTILSFYTPTNPTQFLVRQWRDGLLVSRDIVKAGNNVKRAKFDVDHVFRAGRLLLVTITSGLHGTVAYVNGQPVQVYPRFITSQKELSGQIVMGTSAVDYEPWPGEVRGLAIYSKELTPAEVLRHYGQWSDGRGIDSWELSGAMAYYSFTERAGREIHSAVASGPDLQIPRTFTVPYKAFLQSPVKEFEASWNYAEDLLMNIAGFVPLGFLFCAYCVWRRSRWKAILCATLAGGILSLTIEVLQAYIPQRVSGTTDIITNTLGTALGAVLVRPSMIRMILRQGVSRQ